jgi:ribosomal protein L37AE/L43A
MTEPSAPAPPTARELLDFVQRNYRIIFNALQVAPRTFVPDALTQAGDMKRLIDWRAAALPPEDSKYSDLLIELAVAKGDLFLCPECKTECRLGKARDGAWESEGEVASWQETVWECDKCKGTYVGVPSASVTFAIELCLRRIVVKLRNQRDEGLGRR